VAKSSTTTKEIAHTRTVLQEDKLKDLPSISKVMQHLLQHQLNDVNEALADYNRTIELHPKDAWTYYNRGSLKSNKLNDRAGAIQDFRQAARLFREQGNTVGLKRAIDRLKELGAME
jgi:tetratricopeptide (TPR) repeat protein